MRNEKGALILFDFKAAFPSISHDYMWAMLNHLGVPAHVLRAYKALYHNNKHQLSVDGSLYP